MKTNIEKNENSLMVVSAIANPEAWKKAVAAEFKKASEEVEVPGFRKGKVPEAKIKDLVDMAGVLHRAADSLLNDLYIKALDDHSIVPVAQPTLDVTKIDEHSLEVIFNIAIMPEFEVAEYKGLSATKDVALVEEDEIEAKINTLLTENVQLEVVDREAQNGDTVVIDFDGYKDDVAFEGGKAESYPLELGSQSFIPGFEEQLLGKKAGDKVNVDVVFPENYQAKDLAGAPVVFKVVVHEVKAKEVVELNDEFVASLDRDGVNTVAELKESVSAEILANKVAESESKYLNDLIKQVIEATTIDIPQAMIDGETESMYSQTLQNLQMQGLDEQTFLGMTGKTKEEIFTEMTPDAIDRIKYTLVLEAIAKKENIEVSEADIDEEFAKIATMYNMEVEQVKEMIPNTNGIMSNILLDKAATVVKENAK